MRMRTCFLVVLLTLNNVHCLRLGSSGQGVATQAQQTHGSDVQATMHSTPLNHAGLNWHPEQHGQRTALSTEGRPPHTRTLSHALAGGLCDTHPNQHLCQLVNSHNAAGMFFSGQHVNDTTCQTIPAGFKAAMQAPGLVAPVVVFTHARPITFQKTLYSLISRWQATNATKRFPLFISVDGTGQSSLHVALFAAAAMAPAPAAILQHVPEEGKPGPGLRSDHIMFLLGIFFKCLKAPRLIFVESNVEVAPDFFPYYEKTSALLSNKDSGLWCVHTSSDNSAAARKQDSKLLMRTDLLPGRGSWMMAQPFATELLAQPPVNFEDAVRLEQVTKGRQCLLPAMPRTRLWTSDGAMGGPNDINLEAVDWNAQDLSHVSSTEMYSEWVGAQVAAAEQLQMDQLHALSPAPAAGTGKAYKLTYDGSDGLKALAKLLPFVHGAVKLGHPRPSHRGTVFTQHKGHTIILVPSSQAPPAKSEPL